MDDLRLWAPRILAIGVALFLGAFALDDVGEGRAFLVHLLPALAVFAITAAAWRWPIVGAVAFIIAAVAYAAMVPDRPSWIATISGPLFVVGALFFLSWRTRRAA
jgi:hypothetical protein